jgi:hypothetical protein
VTGAPADRGPIVPVLIASPLEEQLAAEIAAVDVRIDLLYDPALLPPPRYVCDHDGDARFRRDAPASDGSGTGCAAASWSSGSRARPPRRSGS